MRNAFLQSANGEHEFERVIAEILADHQRLENPAMVERLGLLREIPFAAVLTTSYDPNFRDSPAAKAYPEVLRPQPAWWASATWDQSPNAAELHAIKLHGDANGDPKNNPIVLAKDDYRRLLYNDAQYGNFLRAVFATRTVLFLGVSFTDAYLNELRSEIVALLSCSIRLQRDSASQPSLGYAVMSF